MRGSINKDFLLTQYGFLDMVPQSIDIRATNISRSVSSSAGLIAYSQGWFVCKGRTRSRERWATRQRVDLRNDGGLRRERRKLGQGE